MRALTSRSVVAAALFLLATAAGARVVNPTPGQVDAWSVYGDNCYSNGQPTGCEVAVDASGNFIPTTDNTQTLGSSALRWSAINAVEFYGDASHMTGVPSTGALQGYLPLTGGTLTGALSGTTITASTGAFTDDGTSATLLPNNPLSAACTTPGDCQVNIQNKNSTGTSGYTATADNGSNNADYINWGTNNSAYNGAAAGFFDGPYDSFIIGNGGNLNLFVTTPGKSFSISVGGTAGGTAIIEDWYSTGPVLNQGSLTIANGGVSASTAVVTTQVTVGANTTLTSSGLGINGLTPLGQGVAASGANTDLTCSTVGCQTNLQDGSGNVGARFFPSQMAVAVDSATTAPNANLVVQSNKAPTQPALEVSSGNATSMFSVTGNGNAQLVGTLSAAGATLTGAVSAASVSVSGPLNSSTGVFTTQLSSYAVANATGGFTNSTLGKCVALSTVTLTIPAGSGITTVWVSFVGSSSSTVQGSTTTVGFLVNGAFASIAGVSETTTRGVLSVGNGNLLGGDDMNISFPDVPVTVTSGTTYNFCLTIATTSGAFWLDNVNEIPMFKARYFP